MTNSSNPNSFQTPLASPNTKKRTAVCPGGPNREGNSNKIISIPFPMMYQENRFSTPVKRRRVNPDAPGAPIKSQKRLLQTTLDDFKKELFLPNFSDSLRKRINEKRKLKDIKPSKCPGAPMKIGMKKKSNQGDLNCTKKRLFENKENNFSPYSRIL
jgi:hypothetical protein